MGYHQFPLDFADALDAEQKIVVSAASLPFGDPLSAVLAVDPFVDIINLDTDAKVARALTAIRSVLERQYPCAVAWSGGKDSTVMLMLVLEAALGMKQQGIPIPQILVTHARTGIDNPAIDSLAKRDIARIRSYAALHELPVRVDVAEPSLNDSWAVRIISGRALPTFANSSTRDCTISWKLLPQQRQRKVALKELKADGTPVVLVGTRYEESSSRSTRMSERGELDSEIWIQENRSKDGTVTGQELRLSPVAWWTQDDVWIFLNEVMESKRTSYTDAKDLWEVYQDGGNSTCVVLNDDFMKANSKACGARFGCSLCTAVGRDKSLEAMIESDEKYAYMNGLNRLQRFMVDTQYDMGRRSWLGRTIQDDGYIAIAPDTYSPEMQREMLRYSLTIDREEARAAAKLGIAARFELVSLQQLIAIDAIWSIQGYHPRPFEAFHIWESVYVDGKTFTPPSVDSTVFEKKIPKPMWLFVGEWDRDSGFSTMYTGARHMLADLSGATESGGCMQNIELSDGRVVMDIGRSDMFSVDEEGAELFLAFEILESEIHKSKAGCDSGEAFRHYQMLGTIQTGTRHLGLIDDMLRRAAWKRRHGVFSMSRDELLSRSVSETQRKGGLRAPIGQQTLSQILKEETRLAHEKREATGLARMVSRETLAA